MTPAEQIAIAGALLKLCQRNNLAVWDKLNGFRIAEKQGSREIFIGWRKAQMLVAGKLDVNVLLGRTKWTS